jgi:ParB family chromosome partitioning protein
MGTGAYQAGPALPAGRDRHLGISLAQTDEIRINPYQPRRDFDEKALGELCESIKTSGIIQPLLVRKDAAGEYQLIAGERRLRAAKLAGLKQVPVVIRKTTDREALELALIENIQRQNLNCIDEALAYFQLTQEFSLTQEEVAQRVGKERATVANHMRLLRLPEAIIDDLRLQILSFGHGKVILGLDDNDARLRLRAEIVERHLSVREAEAIVERMKAEAAGAPVLAAVEGAHPPTPVQARFQALSQELTRHWSAKVEIKGSERRGKITIHYGSRQELDRLLEAMHNQ